MGLRRLLVDILGAWDSIIFRVRISLFGFENANSMLRLVDKRSVIRLLLDNGAHIGPDADIETPLIVHNTNGSYSNLTIGSDCHVGKNVFLDLRNRIEIGNRVTISMGVTIATHTDVGRSELIKSHPPSSAPVTLEDDCYVGANATLLQGVKLGKGCIVGAGSLVKQTFPAYAVVGGVPAKIIKKLEH